MCYQFVWLEFGHYKGVLSLDSLSKMGDSCGRPQKVYIATQPCFGRHDLLFFKAHFVNVSEP